MILPPLFAFFCNFVAKTTGIMKKCYLIVCALTLLTACQESLEEKCAKEAAIYTRRNCPRMIDNNIWLDSMTFETASHTLHYYYRLTGDVTDIDDQRRSDARKLLLKELCNTTAMQPYKDAGYRFHYQYRSDSNPQEIVFDFLYTKKDYQTKK